MDLHAYRNQLRDLCCYCLQKKIFAFLNSEVKHLAASLDLISSFRNQFLFTPLPMSKRTSDPLAHECRGVVLSMQLLNLVQTCGWIQRDIENTNFQDSLCAFKYNFPSTLWHWNITKKFKWKLIVSTPLKSFLALMFHYFYPSLFFCYVKMWKHTGAWWVNLQLFAIMLLSFMQLWFKNSKNNNCWKSQQLAIKCNSF